MSMTIIRKAITRAIQYQNFIEVFSFLVFANILTAFAGWLTQVKIANTMGKESFGQIAYGMVIGSFGQVFIRAGVDSTLVRDLIHYPNQAAELIYGSLYLRSFLFLTGISALLSWKILLSRESLNWGIILIILGWSMISLDLQPVYDAFSRIKLHTTYFLIQKSFYLIVVWCIIVILPHHLSVLSIGAILVISVTLYLFLQYRWALSHLHEKYSSFRKNINASWRLLRNNMLIWFTAITGLMIGMFNQLVLKKYFGFSELGGYAAAWQFVTIGTLFIEQVSRIGRPEMARFTRDEIPLHERKHFLIRYAITMMVVTIPIVLAMAFFPHLLLNTLFKPEYTTMKTARALSILGIFLFTCSIGYVLSQYMIAMRLEKKYFLSIATGGILSVALCFILIPAYGCTGAAISLTLSYASTVCLFGMFSLKSLLVQKETR